MTRKINLFYTLCIAFCLVIVLNSNAQVANDNTYNQIVVEADSVVQTGNTISVRYIFTTYDSQEKIVSPTWNWDKSNSHYNVLYGPSHSTNTSFKHINGKATTTITETFSFRLRFNKEGIFTLPPMIAKTTSGKELQSKPFIVRVTKEHITPSSDLGNNVQQSSTPKDGVRKSSSPKENLLVLEATVNKDHIELGDSVECEIRLILNNTSVNRMMPSNSISITNAYYKNLEILENGTVEKFKYKGNSVYSTLWKKILIIPIQSGKVTLEPIDFIVTRSILNPNNDPLDYFFGGGGGIPYKYKDTIIASKPVIIEVAEKQLPAKDIKFDIDTPKHNTGIVIDRSSSLNAKPDSISASFSQLQNHFLEQFLDEKSKSNYSITYFAGKPHYPTTSELSNIPGVTSSKENGGSAVYDALLASALREGALTTERVPYSILLLTDGGDNASRLSLETLTNLLLKHGVRVDVIAFASERDSIYYDYKINDAIEGFFAKNNKDYRDVERIARATNGQFILVEKESQIPEAIRTIREKIQKTEAPKQKPEKQFKPEKSLLYGVYKEIMSDAKTDF